MKKSKINATRRRRPQSREKQIIYVQSKPRTSLASWFVLFVIVFVVGFYYLKVKPISDKRNQVANKTEATAKAKPIEITAVQLMKEYEANEVRADKKYKGKWLRIKGFIKSIGKDVLGNAYVTLETNNTFSVQCMFKNSDLSGLNKSDGIFALGKCKGMFLNLIVESCE